MHFIPHSYADLGQQCNIILCSTHEYRPPDKEELETLGDKVNQNTNPLSVPYTSRFVGLVVIPGACIRHIQLECTHPTTFSPHPYQPLAPFR